MSDDWRRGRSDAEIDADIAEGRRQIQARREFFARELAALKGFPTRAARFDWRGILCLCGRDDVDHHPEVDAAKDCVGYTSADEVRIRV